jgi:hypothetical protein
MESSQAQGHAEAALHEARSRTIAPVVARAAGASIPGNEPGQRRWSKRVIEASGRALIGKPAARFGRRFELALPIFASRLETLEAGWDGLALGQLGFSPGAVRDTAYQEMILCLDSHALTRIGQGAGVVGLENLLDLVKPSLPWCAAHAIAAGVAGVGRAWLPVAGGVLICRLVPEGKEPRRRSVLFAADFVSETRLRPCKSRVLAMLRRGQDAAAPRFPRLGGSRGHGAPAADLATRLLPAYLQLSACVDVDAA